MTNFGLADSFLRFIESQNDFKEVITRFQKYVYFPRYSGVRTLQVKDRTLQSSLAFVKDAAVHLTQNRNIPKITTKQPILQTLHIS